jgi:hypothetical protein
LKFGTKNTEHVHSFWPYTILTCNLSYLFFIKGTIMSGKTALITGATGLLGRQVVRAFERSKWDVKGTGYSRADGISVLKVDLAKGEEVEACLEKIKYVTRT